MMIAKWFYISEWIWRGYKSLLSLRDL